MTETGSNDAKPLPKLEGATAEFYDWCRRGELRIQRCSKCRQWRHVPREMCAACGSFDWSWEQTSGRGTVFTWTVTMRAMDPAFHEDVPFAPAVVELEEGVRLLSHVVDCPPDELEMGMPVEVVFEAVTDDVTLPKFRRARS